MKVAVVIPGIMGSELHLPNGQGGKGEKVWPPTPLEATTRYRRIAELQRPDLLVGAPIDSVLCFNFYNLMDRLLYGLGYSKKSSTKRQVDFPYDWRQDNRDTAGLLAQLLAALHDDGAEEIYLLAHSMGGLISRLVLESGQYDKKLWFRKIRLFVAMGTPHLGAPLALARIFGLDSDMGISGRDFATLAANRNYPSGYQLIPAPGEAAVWDLNSPDVAPLNPYDRAVAADLGMDPELVGKAEAMHNLLTQGSKPDHVRYFYFAGTGHRTVTRVNAKYHAGNRTDHSRSVVTRTVSAGDGTVPLYSALPVPGQRQIVINQHATVFKGVPFAKVFYRLMGGDFGAPIEAAPGVVRPAGMMMHLSLDSHVYEASRPPELVMCITDPDDSDGEGVGYASAITGKLLLHSLDEAQKPRGDPQQIPLSYEGAPVSSLTMLITVPLEPGLYSLSFKGSLSSEAPAAFAVRPSVFGDD